MDEATRDDALVLLPRPDGTDGFIEAGAIRALMGYIEQRDAENAEAPDEPNGSEP